MMSLEDKIREFNRRIAENPDMIAGPAERIFNAETDFFIAQTLPEKYNLCGIKVQAPSIGVVMLLTCINSPFVVQDEAATLKDVLEALFIIKYRNLIGSYLIHKKEVDIVLARIEHECIEKPQLFDAYMKNVLRNRNYEYDQLFFEFSNQMQLNSMSEAVIEIGRYLGSPSKKNCSWKIFSGLREMLQRFLAKTFTMLCGK